MSLIELRGLTVRVVLLLGIVVGLSSCGTDSYGPGDGNEVDAWHVAMLDVSTPGAGCHEVVHPSMRWEEVECSEARTDPFLPAEAAVDGTDLARVAHVGNGNDWAVSVSGGTLSNVTGSFDNISGVTSITDETTGANSFSLQLNTSFFPSPVCPTDNSGCRGFQQVVYASNGAGAGQLILQYWLIDYNRTCPSEWRPVLSGDCVRNAQHQPSVPPQTISSLGKMFLTGIAGGNDQAILRIGNVLYSATAPDSALRLASAWNAAEFNIFGNGGGGQANFNANSSIDVKLTVNGFSGGTLSCEKAGYTAETINLDLVGGCMQTPNQTHPTFVFTQANT